MTPQNLDLNLKYLTSTRASSQASMNKLKPVSLACLYIISVDVDNFHQFVRWIFSYLLNVSFIKDGSLACYIKGRYISDIK